MVVVTGATGTIGAPLIRRLIAAGVPVRATARRPSAALEGAPFVAADLRDPAALARALDGGEVLIHLAAWLGSRGEPGAAEALNVDAVGVIADLAADAGFTRMVQVSSVAALGPPGDRRVLDSACPADTEQDYVYGRTKALGEERARAAAAARGLELVVLRPGMVHGPGCAVWTRDLQDLVRRGLPTLFGDGDGLAPLIYVDNLVDVLVAAADHPAAAGRTFNACDPPVTWRRLFEAHGQIAGRPPRAVPLPVARAVAAVGDALGLKLPISRHRLAFVTGRARYDDGLARALLGLGPAVGFEEAMARSAQWLVEQVADAG